MPFPEKALTNTEIEAHIRSQGSIDPTPGRWPTSRELMSFLENLVRPGEASMCDLEIPPSCFEEYIPRFTTEELLEVFDICVRGTRKEVSEARLEQPWKGAGFATLAEDVLTDGDHKLHEQLRELGVENRMAIITTLEELARQCERKAADLVFERIETDKEQVEFLITILEASYKLRRPISELQPH